MKSLSDGKSVDTIPYGSGRILKDSPVAVMFSTRGRNGFRLCPKTVRHHFFLFASICWFLTAGTVTADMVDMPVGHMKITDGSDGRINVEARCVATVELISAICAKGGMHAVYETPCRTYETVWSPGIYKLPGEWLHFYGITCLVKADDSLIGPTIATKNSKYPTVQSGVFPANYDFETGKLVSLKRHGPDVLQSVQALKSMWEWESELERGEHILLRSTCKMTLGGPTLQTLLANLKLVSSFSILQSECLISEAVADRPQACLIAIRLKSNCEKMISALSDVTAMN